LTVARGELLELEPGEELLAVARASFRGAALVTTRATFALGPGRTRLRAFHAWHDVAMESGLPPVTPDMMVAATDRRVLFGRPTFWGRPPARYSGAIPLARIAQVIAVRHGLVTGVAFAFTDGGIVEIEAIRARRLRRVVQALNDHLDAK
jgi:hypothetical protein